MTSREEIIALLAKEKGILLDKEDPVLSFLAVHELMLSHTLKQLAQENIELESHLKEQLEAIQDSYIQKSKEVAKTIIGQTIDELVACEQRIKQHLDFFHNATLEENTRLQRLERTLLIFLTGISFGVLGMFILMVVR